MLSQIGKSDHVTRLIVSGPFVCHPDFHLADRDGRRNRVQVFHRFVIAVTEIVRQEEMAVFLILVDRQFEWLCLHASF